MTPAQEPESPTDPGQSPSGRTIALVGLILITSPAVVIGWATLGFDHLLAIAVVLGLFALLIEARNSVSRVLVLLGLIAWFAWFVRQLTEGVP